MKSITALGAAWLSLLAPAAAAISNASGPQQVLSHVDLPPDFRPPLAFENVNLVHTISLEKNYVKESVNVLIKCVNHEAQDEYFLPFTAEQMWKVGGIEVKDRKDSSVTGFVVEPVEFDIERQWQYYRIRLPKPLRFEEQQTLGITFYYVDSLIPLPAAIGQSDKQYLVYPFSVHFQSAYQTLKQKTELKFASTEIPDYTKVPGNDDVKEFPQKQGNKLTYGPFTEVIEDHTATPVKVRYEFTNSVTHIRKLERDIEVSHWGGNIAFEDRYTLYNHGANLTTLFNRVQWTQSQYYNPQSSALKELKFPLSGGSKDAYFTDVIGNVSTSRFRTNKREAHLEIKPRYPIFGGWKYPFTVGWNSDTKTFLRRYSGDNYLLNIPFLEGPKQKEGVEYKEIVLRVLLPEGAENVKFHTQIPASSIDEYTVDQQRTYLDTIGRTVLTIKARNIPDEFRGRELIVSYDYTYMASLRKPLFIFASMMSVFVVTWSLSKVELKFSK